MVRVGGMSYAIEPQARVGRRISSMRIGEELVQAGKRYPLAGWAPVAEGASGEPVWDLVTRHLRALKSVPPLQPSRPRLIGVGANPGLA
jgi:sulfur-oxidizing protein SoxB